MTSDLDAICAIADASFSVPWPRSELEAELTRPYSTVRVLRPSELEPIAAFANHWLLGDELQLMNIAVLPSSRRRGFARALLGDAEQHARAHGLTAVFLEVRRSNHAAIVLYESAGYAVIGVRQRYYSDDGEDALVMKRDMDGRFESA